MRRIKKGYEIADFKKAQDFLHTQSYRRKRVNQGGPDDY